MRSSKSNYLLHDSTSPKASCVLHYFLFNSIKSQLIEFIRLNNVNACIDDNKSHSTVNGISPPNNVHHTKNEKNKIQINWRAFFAVLLYGLWNWYVFVLLQKNVLLIAKANDLKQLGNCQMSTIAPFSLSLTAKLLCEMWYLPTLIMLRSLLLLLYRFFSQNWALWKELGIYFTTLKL